MTCYLCGAPFSWRGPSPITGREQRWRRASEETTKGTRCADQGACKARRHFAAASRDEQPTLFELP
jgi:hypothetical protein